MSSNTITLPLANLHDAFMNASLQRSMMFKTPVSEKPELDDYTDHWRFERTWAAFLYVLIEAWHADAAASVRAYLASLTDLTDLETILAEGKANGAIAKLEQVRHYMCHRDRREYWDQGRTAVLLQLDYNERLHAAFSRVLLVGMRSLVAK